MGKDLLRKMLGTPLQARTGVRIVKMTISHVKRRILQTKKRILKHVINWLSLQCLDLEMK